MGGKEGGGWRGGSGRRSSGAPSFENPDWLACFSNTCYIYKLLVLNGSLCYSHLLCLASFSGLLNLLTFSSTSILVTIVTPLNRVLLAKMEVERLRVAKFYHYYHSKKGMWGTRSMFSSYDRDMFGRFDDDTDIIPLYNETKEKEKERRFLQIRKDYID